MYKINNEDVEETIKEVSSIDRMNNGPFIHSSSTSEVN